MLVNKILPKKESTSIGKLNSPFNKAYVRNVNVNKRMTVNGNLKIARELILNNAISKLHKTDTTTTLDKFIDGQIKNKFDNLELTNPSIYNVTRLVYSFNNILTEDRYLDLEGNKYYQYNFSTLYSNHKSLIMEGKFNNEVDNDIIGENGDSINNTRPLCISNYNTTNFILAIPRENQNYYDYDYIIYNFSLY